MRWVLGPPPPAWVCGPPPPVVWLVDGRKTAAACEEVLFGEQSSMFSSHSNHGCISFSMYHE